MGFFDLRGFGFSSLVTKIEEKDNRFNALTRPFCGDTHMKDAGWAIGSNSYAPTEGPIESSFQFR